MVQKNVLFGIARYENTNTTIIEYLNIIVFIKLGTYTITNTLVGGRNTWISDTDPDFVITWCGKFIILLYVPINMGK